MKQPFALAWLGGSAERYFRRIRPGVEQLPWGTLDPSRYPALLVDRARVSWTEAAYNEYCTAMAFADLVRALLECNAPIDLVGMAGDFLADEMSHVELTSRVAMELGGGAPYEVDFEGLGQPARPELTPLQRASQQIVELCCVAEAFSLPMLNGCRSSAQHPLTRGVLEIIVKDEAPHGHLGYLFLDWAANLFDEAERARLAQVALDEVRRFEPYWRRLTSRVVDGVTSDGFLIEHVYELGWMEAEAYGTAAREAMRNQVIDQLARYDITLDSDACETLLS